MNLPDLTVGEVHLIAQDLKESILHALQYFEVAVTDVISEVENCGKICALNYLKGGTTNLIKYISHRKL